MSLVLESKIIKRASVETTRKPSFYLPRERFHP